MVDSTDIVKQQDNWVLRWHQHDDLRPSLDPLTDLILQNHRANFDLWHEEDKARDPGASDSAIAEVKHSIDRFNQQRNDLVEAIDETLLAALPPAAPGTPLHSETPGMMIDRMSILALKIFHTREQAERLDVPEAHRISNRARLQLLEEQRADLAACLAGLWSDALAGRRAVKLYRQLKMYNDPELNPAIYGARQAPPATPHHPGSIDRSAESAYKTETRAGTTAQAAAKPGLG